MPYNFNRTHIKQIYDFWFTFYCLLSCEERPFSRTDLSKISISNPLGSLVSMSFPGPDPQIFEDAAVNIAKGFLGTNISMVVGPSPHN